ncbi:MAG: hypothetical protein JWO38_4185 [Gemmataceae bacterium]|nr:hypothetical protein [Gemmataceae bacterium]
MSSPNNPYGDIRHPYDLPMGTVRGFMSVLICMFFWIILLLPDQRPLTAPLAHFFLLTLVFLAFASHPVPHDNAKSELLPWLMRVLFVGGSVAVVGFVAYKYPNRLAERLTPDAGEIGQWPVLLGTLAGGFGTGLFLRFALGRNSELFQTIRGWVGVIASLLLVAETVFQFAIRPTLAEAPDPNMLKVWECVIIAFVAAYFGSRA